MSDTIPNIPTGRVASLHLHPVNPDDGLTDVPSIEVEVGAGIRDDHRYYKRIRSSTGKVTRRQVTLTEREIIAEHAATLGLERIPPGAIRSNIETTGIDLIKFLGQHVAVGGAILHFYEPRTPCEKMDALCAGLRAQMQDNRQGVLAQIIQSGTIRVGDSITPLPAPLPVPAAA